MWKQIAVAGAVGAAIVGSAGAALAASSPSTTPSASSSSSSTPKTSTPKTATPKTATGKHHDRDRLARALHAQWVTQDKKTGTDVTHDEIRGDVTAVSATSITVKAADGVSQTYAVTSATKVHAKGDSKTTPGTVSQVKTGDRAIVVGTGTTALTAAHIDDRGVPKTS